MPITRFTFQVAQEEARPSACFFQKSKVEEARDRRKARTGVGQFLALDSPPKEGFDKEGRSSADLFHPLLHKHRSGAALLVTRAGLVSKDPTSMLMHEGEMRHQIWGAQLKLGVMQFVAWIAG
jgi:hypothetical protein